MLAQGKKTLAEQKAAVLAAAALKKAQRRAARQREEAENLERMRLARQAEAALDESALASQVHNKTLMLFSRHFAIPQGVLRNLMVR